MNIMGRIVIGMSEPLPFDKNKLPGQLGIGSIDCYLLCFWGSFRTVEGIFAHRIV